MSPRGRISEWTIKRTFGISLVLWYKRADTYTFTRCFGKKRVETSVLCHQGKRKFHNFWLSCMVFSEAISAWNIYDKKGIHRSCYRSHTLRNILSKRLRIIRLTCCWEEMIENNWGDVIVEVCQIFGLCSPETKLHGYSFSFLKPSRQRRYPADVITDFIDMTPEIKNWLCVGLACSLRNTRLHHLPEKERLGKIERVTEKQRDRETRATPGNIPVHLQTLYTKWYSSLLRTKHSKLHARVFYLGLFPFVFRLFSIPFWNNPDWKKSKNLKLIRWQYVFTLY